MLGATCQQQVLQQAGALLMGRPRTPIHTLEEYAATARKDADEFGAFDRQFYDCQPSLWVCTDGGVP